MAKSTIEERLNALELELADVKRQLRGERPGVVGKTRPDFLQNYTLRSANSPLFDEVTQAIQGEREREREEARKAAEGENA